MARLTITLPDPLHKALKQAAARQGRPIGELVVASLEFYGIKTEESVRELLVRARERSRLPESDAIELAIAETEAYRKR